MNKLAKLVHKQDILHGRTNRKSASSRSSHTSLFQQTTHHCTRKSSSISFIAPLALPAQTTDNDNKLPLKMATLIAIVSSQETKSNTSVWKLKVQLQQGGKRPIFHWPDCFDCLLIVDDCHWLYASFHIEKQWPSSFIAVISYLCWMNIGGSTCFSSRFRYVVV